MWYTAAASFVVTLLVAPWALLPWGVILAVILGLALHLFETPLVRALTLGLLQGLYALMGAAAGRLTLGVGFFAARPSPVLARVLTPVCMMGLGLLICLAMILGSM